MFTCAVWSTLLFTLLGFCSIRIHSSWILGDAHSCHLLSYWAGGAGTNRASNQVSKFQFRLNKNTEKTHNKNKNKKKKELKWLNLSWYSLCFGFVPFGRKQIQCTRCNIKPFLAISRASQNFSYLSHFPHSELNPFLTFKKVSPMVKLKQIIKEALQNAE